MTSAIGSTAHGIARTCAAAKLAASRALLRTDQAGASKYRRLALDVRRDARERGHVGRARPFLHPHRLAQRRARLGFIRVHTRLPKVFCNRARARDTRDFTVPTGTSVTWAISA